MELHEHMEKIVDYLWCPEVEHYIEMHPEEEKDIENGKVPKDEDHIFYHLYIVNKAINITKQLLK